ncbi:Imm1 family immunity protein [Actinosynnema sp. NPDC023587]|uniref:Imm1 family immunity protein n=1 Tax=Actinosynnema sp. NPDC023587 TaxID=3154695 RepID=UPI0033F06C5F
MSAALTIWYYRHDGRDGEDPEVVSTPDALDRILDYILDHPQPHPPVLTVRDRPRLMDGRYPDHEVKIDADRDAGLGAVLCSGPADFAPDATVTGGDGGSWMTLARGTHPPHDTTPALYMDKATRTEFPSDALLPLALWRKSLHELLQTGRRPTCVQWQDTDLS